MKIDLQILGHENVSMTCIITSVTWGFGGGGVLGLGGVLDSVFLPPSSSNSRKRCFIFTESSMT